MSVVIPFLMMIAIVLGVVSVMGGHIPGTFDQVRESWTPLQARAERQLETKIDGPAGLPTVASGTRVMLTLTNDGNTALGQFSREALAMQCPSCGHDNPPGAGFCGSCGIELAAEGQCAACQQHNPSDAQFCNNCGTVLRCSNCSRSNVGEGRFCRWCQQFLVAPQGVQAAGIGRRVAAYILDIVLFF